jgi:Phage tail-collar fibre protein
VAVIVSDSFTTVTTAGTQAIITAGSTGPQINITGFTIGSQSAAQGATPDPTQTAVLDLVYTGTTNQIAFLALPDQDACLFRITLDPTTVGTFQVGQIGLMIGNTLFALAVLLQQQPKIQQNLPGTLGNALSFDFILGISNASACINLTLLQSLEASLPEVTDETALPNASTTLFNTYYTRNNTLTGNPALATRLNGNWYFDVQRLTAGQGNTVLAVNSSLFSPSCQINMAVYYDYTQKLILPADVTSNFKFPIGIMTSTFEITQTGFVTRFMPGTASDIWPATLTPETTYCVQVGSPGIPGVLPTFQVYGIAVDTNHMYVDLADTLNNSFLAQMSLIGPIGGVQPFVLNAVPLSVTASMGNKAISNAGPNNTVIDNIESTLGDGSRIVLV